MRDHLLTAAALAGALAVAAPAAADTLVVLNKSDATASLIDPDTVETVATLPTGDGPHEAATSPDGRLVAVADYGRDTPGNTLTVIDLAAAETVRTIDLGRHTRPHGIRWLSDDRIVVTTEGSRSIVVVDPAEGVVLRAIATDQDVSHMVEVAEGADRAFVANIGSDTVTVIDLAAGSKIADVATGAGAEGLALSPDATRLWVTNRGDDTVTVLDTASLETVAEIAAPSFPIRVAFTPDGERVLVSAARSAEVLVFDAATREQLARIPMGGTGSGEGRLFGDRFGDSPVPIGILVAPDGSRAWVANTNADRVTVVDLAKLEITGVVVAGTEPDGLAYSSVDAGCEAEAPRER